MEITAKNPPINIDAYISNARGKRNMDASSEKASTNVIKEDTVVLSQKGREIQEAKNFLDSVPDIREEKVVRIKKQIENGTYQVDGEKIAIKMIKESLINELV
ncbi:MAG: flagellar biosynthesis anti-sigma factor FlgM [Deltaproteobacteria bacterium]|nr:flagellar biosynthesis anti-sigma factor FlgM [Deltaproteobacteria bacterium]